MSKFANLLGDVAVSLDMETKSLAVTQIPLTRVKPDPKNPRRKFDQAALEQMAESIKTRGVLQPITVRPVGNGTSYVIRYGERRYRAAGIAGLTEIPAIVTNSKADENDILDQVIENDQRENLTTAEMAVVIADALASGMKATDIAKRLGRPKSVIAEYAALAEMPPFLRELAETTAIRTIYELYQGWKTDPAKVEAFVADSDGTGIRRAAARELVRGADAPPTPSPAPVKLNPDEPPLPLGEDEQSSSGRTSDVANGRQESPASAPVAPAPAAASQPVALPESKPSLEAPPKAAKGAAQAKPSPAKPTSDEPKGMAVLVNGRSARLILPPEVSVVYDDDGSLETVTREVIEIGAKEQ